MYSELMSSYDMSLAPFQLHIIKTGNIFSISGHGQFIKEMVHKLCLNVVIKK